MKLKSDSGEEHISLLIDHTWTPTPDNLPPVVLSFGLSLVRQWYLHSQFAEYCPDNVRDIVCPWPLTPLSCATSTAASTFTAAASISTAAAPLSTAASSTSTAAASMSTDGHEVVPLTPAGSSHQSTATAEHHYPPAKWARVCSMCNTPGHDARTCHTPTLSLSFIFYLSTHFQHYLSHYLMHEYSFKTWLRTKYIRLAQSAPISGSSWILS